MYLILHIGGDTAALLKITYDTSIFRAAYSSKLTGLVLVIRKRLIQLVTICHLY